MIGNIKLFICLLLFFIISYPKAYSAEANLAALNPLLGRGTLSHYVQNIRNSYGALLAYQVQNSLQQNFITVRETLQHIHDLQLPLYAPMRPLQPLTAANSDRIILTLHNISRNITAFINQYNALLFPEARDPTFNILQKLIGRVNDRYRLAKIENKIARGQGWMGNNVIAQIPDSTVGGDINLFRNTIPALTGRIFVVRPGLAGANPAIISTSSGMIVPTPVGGAFDYNRIITCGHSMSSTDTNPDLEFYFVRSAALDSRTGLPDPAAIRAALGLLPGIAVGATELVNYLRHQNNPATNTVRRILSFKAFDLPNNHNASILNHHSPRYRPHQDNGYGNLEHTFNFPGVNFAVINVLNALPAVGAVYGYYALGYPGFPHFDITGELPLVQQMRFAPLTMTMSSTNPLMGGFDPVLDNNKIRHGAPTMKGMSGGPVIRFDGNVIEILGVVQSGALDFNYAAKFG